ncbi:MAG TPA: peptide-methionine (S)-S-oxide reductase MsrA [Polyangia bacterium]|jgi:methionine-S-sulfoxide reductase|nr:peptide-methionine (S)-S-oxide reductase MsrA [Polyangia bacterium]
MKIPTPVIALFLLLAPPAVALGLPAGEAAAAAAAPAPATVETATLAAGCFWGTEEFFRKVPGVLQTRVGYTGGHLKNPTYEDTSAGTSGHAESLEVKFDPAKVSYADLLTLFFKMHDPTTANRQGNDVGSQYRSAIFFHDEKQKQTALELMRKIDKSGAWHAKLTTQVAPAGVFYPAEDYHQHYLVKHPGGYDNHYLRNLSFGP